MTSMQMGLLAAAAVLMFWMVGGYNRLVALRNGIGAAVAQLDDGLVRRAAATEPLVQALRAPLQAEQGALDALVAALLGAQAATAALRARPAGARAAQAFSHAEGSWSAAFSRVRSLVEQHPELQADPTVAPQLHALADAQTRVAFARQLFNDAAQAYDDAVRLFPTSLLASLYGFGSAGRL